MRSRYLALLATSLLATIGSIAHADSDPQPRPAEPATPPTPADDDEIDWTTAPRWDQASGVAKPDQPSRKERLLWIPRALLFVPKWVLWGAVQPIRGAAYVTEKYDITGRVQDTVFNTDRTFGIYPIVLYETGFGFTAGARLVHKNIFGADERVKLRVNFGGRYRQAYGVNLRSGERFGKRFAVELDSSYERRPLERFYGIGNNSQVDVAPQMPVDPLSGIAYPTRFREEIVRNVVTIDTPIVGHLHNRVSGALMLRDFAGTDEGNSLDAIYTTDRLTGWKTGVTNLYLENELVYDSRRPTSPYQSEALDAAGWLASVHIGATTGIDGDRSDFFTYGAEVQHFFDLYNGSRVLALRVLAEAIGGAGHDDGEISFIDLPRLGGSDYLRGYPNGRFRDRAITLGSAEYLWDLGNYLGAYTFVDVGRAWPSLAHIGATDVGSLRMGFGGGVQIHTSSSFLTRAQVAASADGDVILELALSPAFGRRERAGRF